MNEHKRNREMLKQYENKKITITCVFRLYNKSIEKFTFEKCEMTNGVKIGHMNFNKKSFNKKHLRFERKETYKLTGIVTEYTRKDGTKSYTLTGITIE